MREATIAGAGIVVELDDDLPPAGRRWIERAVHLPWALTSRGELPLALMPDRPWAEFVAGATSRPTRSGRTSFGDDARGRHRLSPTQLRWSGASTRRGGDLDGAVRRLVERPPRAARPAHPARPAAGTTSCCRPNACRCCTSSSPATATPTRSTTSGASRPTPSRGLVALFSGPSGTGKTLAAEIVAGDLGLDVFKLDLSAVVSKYIGETEKNLEQVFDAAGAGNVVLFFDEADALFGKRSEVQGRPRPLRQHRGVVPAAAARGLRRARRAGDQLRAQHRRRVPAPHPRPRRVHAPRRGRAQGDLGANLPAGARSATSTPAFLADRFELSGGAIRNAAMRAAFAAAGRRDTDHHDVPRAGRGPGVPEGSAVSLRPDEFGPLLDGGRHRTVSAPPPTVV